MEIGGRGHARHPTRREEAAWKELHQYGTMFPCISSLTVLLSLPVSSESPDVHSSGSKQHSECAAASRAATSTQEGNTRRTTTVRRERERGRRGGAGATSHTCCTWWYDVELGLPIESRWIRSGCSRAERAALTMSFHTTHHGRSIARSALGHVFSLPSFW